MAEGTEGQIRIAFGSKSELGILLPSPGSVFLRKELFLMCVASVKGYLNACGENYWNKLCR